MEFFRYVPLEPPGLAPGDVISVIRTDGTQGSIMVSTATPTDRGIDVTGWVDPSPPVPNPL